MESINIKNLDGFFTCDEIAKFSSEKYPLHTLEALMSSINDMDKTDKQLFFNILKRDLEKLYNNIQNL